MGRWQSWNYNILATLLKEVQDSWHLVLEGITKGLRHQGRPKRQWIHDTEEWSGCEYIQLKEMSQDRAQWRRQISEWSSAVANPHRGRSTSEWVTSTSDLPMRAIKFCSVFFGITSMLFVINKSHWCVAWWRLLIAGDGRHIHVM